jgi:uncharacterized repeat protein (TIGR03803 family)
MNVNKDRFVDLVLRKAMCFQLFGISLNIALCAMMLETTAIGQVRVQTIRPFGFPGLFGRYPNSSLLEASDGMLYGSTSEGLYTDDSTIFRYVPNGSDYRVIYHFRGGVNVKGTLAEGADGSLYGTASGGVNGGGLVFKLNKDGSGLTTLYAFSGSSVYSTNGVNPEHGVIYGTDGFLYGTTRGGGIYQKGVVFKLNTTGGSVQVLYHFRGGANNDGEIPRAGLTEGTDGVLYGTTSFGGRNFANGGTVFRINKDGTGYAILRTLGNSGTDGSLPLARVIEASDGFLYGTTWQGVTNRFGTIFRISRTGGDYSIVHYFSSSPGDGQNPAAPVVEASDGTLLGTATAGGPSTNGVVFKLNKDGSGYHVLHSFPSGGASGRYPMGAPLLLGDRLYGTTRWGGARDMGTIYASKLDGTEFSIRYNFTGDGGDGRYAHGRLMRATDGWLYGTTSGGGASNAGTIFRIGMDGAGYAILHHFLGGSSGEGKILNGLVEGPDGQLYGTSKNGGTNLVFAGTDWNAGMIFKISKDGTDFALLHQFEPSTHGYWPHDLIVGSDGALYGATLGNTVFRLNRDGTGFFVLKRCSGLDGAVPSGGLLEASDGRLYGVAAEGGARNRGVIYRIDQGGSAFAVLRHFAGGTNDGARPVAALIEGSDGALYGGTAEGGTWRGTVFRINKDGSGYAVLHHFLGWPSDGYSPHGGLVEAVDGLLYGVAWSANSSSVLFRLRKDGTGHSIFGDVWGTFADAPLLHGPDHALYGARGVRGSFGLGDVFKVAIAPVLQRPPQSTNVPKGTDVTFNVEALGTEPMTYQWHRSNTNLPATIGTTLAMPNVMRADAGKYSVSVSNAAGVTTSTQALLRVFSAQQFASPVISAGGQLQLVFGDADGEPLASSDIESLEVQATSQVPSSNWITLTNALILTNGRLRIVDTLQATPPSRFYRAVEK